jgi:hypothetical protein
MGQVSGSDLLRDAVAELYACDPAEFVARRGDLAARARAAGETAAARQIAGLRKPTRSAWVLNRLARAEPDAADRLAELGAELGAAQQALDGAAIRRLSQQRRELVNALARDAFAAAGQRSVPASLREEVVTTLSAALVDPEVAELLRAGAVQRVMSRDGLDSGADSASPAAWSRPTTGSKRSGSPATGGSTVVPLRPGRRAAGAGSPAPGSAGQQRSGAKVTALTAARAKAERAKAERARAERARRRTAIVAAEQTAARAERAERSAARTEQDQERGVQLLEKELAEARQRLAEARLRARRARTEQRQAQRALDRLRDAPGPGENG